MAIVANLTTPIYQEWWKQHIGINPKIAKKLVVNNAQNLYEPGHLKDYRLIYSAMLYVRASGSMDAEIIDGLAFGKIVRVIDYAGVWTKIQYLNDVT